MFNALWPVVVLLAAGLLPGGATATGPTPQATALASGWNAEGQLGDGTTTSRQSYSQAAVASIDLIKGIAVGSTHSLFLDTAGNVFFAGTSDVGQAGLGASTLVASTPTALPLPAAVQVHAAKKSSMVVTKEGAVLVAGDNASGALGLPGVAAAATWSIPVFAAPMWNGTDPVVAACLSSSHAVLITRSGEVRGAGSNSAGELGMGHFSSVDSFAVVNPPGGMVPTGGAMVRCGHRYTYIATTDGLVWSAGRNADGQLGVGDISSRSVFTNNLNVSPDTVAGMALGAESAFVVTSGGSLYHTGVTPGETGLLAMLLTPTKSSIQPFPSADLPGGLGQILDIALVCGTTFMMLDSNGRAWGLGDNDYGELGIGTSPVRDWTDLGQSDVTLIQGFSGCVDCRHSAIVSGTGAPQSPACPAGYLYTGSITGASCEPCPRGTSVNGYVSCDPCPPGTFAATEASAACKPCAVGHYQGDAGETFCWRAPYGHFVNTTGATAPSECPAGQYQDALGQGGCKGCAGPEFSPRAGSAKCQPCPAGYFLPETSVNATSCNPCGEDSYQFSAGAVGCLACPAGFGSGTASASCVATNTTCPQADRAAMPPSNACPSGTYRDGNACLYCPRGSYQGGVNETSCIATPIGSFSNETGATAPLPCGPGQYSDSKGAVSCKECFPGRYTDRWNSSACTLCPAGMYQAVEGSAGCEPCPPGSYNALQGQFRCIPSPPGTHVPAANSTAPTPCPPATFTSTSGNVMCEPCPLGSGQGKPGQSSCVDCPPGTFANVTGLERCHPCQPGHFQDQQGQDSCVPCPVQSYQDGFGSSSCLPCSPSTYALSNGSVACSGCPNGTVAIGAVSGPADCAACGLGTRAVSGTSTCAECLPGTYSNTLGSTSCLPCPVGHHQPSNTSLACLACPVGTYAPVTGLSTCIQCPAGTLGTLTGQSRCADCPPGRSSAEGGDTCFRCPADTYTSGGTGCIPCPPGYTSSGGSSQCSECSVGTYRDGSNGTLSGCRQCPLGSTSARGAKDITECACDYGEFGDPLNGVPCRSCPSNTICGRGERIPYAEEGYWVHESQPSTSYRCVPSSACLGGVSSASSESSVCRDGYEGVSCNTCSYGYFRSKSECLECPQGVQSGWLVYVTLVAIVVGTPIVVSALVLFCYSQQTCIGVVDTVNAGMERGKSAKGKTISNSVKIVKMVQMLNVAFSVNTAWGPIGASLTWVFSIAMIDFQSLFTIECIDNAVMTPLALVYLKMLILPYFLVILYVCLVPAFATRCCHFMYCGALKRRATAIFRGGKNIIVKGTLFPLMVSYLTLHANLMEWVTCYDRGDGTFWMLSRPDTQCFVAGAEWGEAIPVLVIFFLLYSIGIPALFGLLFVYARSRMKHGHIRRRFGFLWQSFHNRFFYWEIFMMVQKFFWGLLPITILWGNAEMATFLILCVTFFLVIHTWNQPFDTKEDNVMEFNMHFSLFVVCLTGLLLSSDDGDSLSPVFAWALEVVLLLTILWVWAYILHVLLKDTGLGRKIRKCIPRDMGRESRGVLSRTFRRCLGALLCRACLRLARRRTRNDRPKPHKARSAASKLTELTALMDRELQTGVLLDCVLEAQGIISPLLVKSILCRRDSTLSSGSTSAIMAGPPPKAIDLDEGQVQSLRGLVGKGRLIARFCDDLEKLILEATYDPRFKFSPPEDIRDNRSRALKRPSLGGLLGENSSDDYDGVLVVGERPVKMMGHSGTYPSSPFVPALNLTDEVQPPARAGAVDYQVSIGGISLQSYGAVGSEGYIEVNSTARSTPMRADQTEPCQGDRPDPASPGSSDDWRTPGPSPRAGQEGPTENPSESDYSDTEFERSLREIRNKYSELGLHLPTVGSMPPPPMRKVVVSQRHDFDDDMYSSAESEATASAFATQRSGESQPSHRHTRRGIDPLIDIPRIQVKAKRARAALGAIRKLASSAEASPRVHPASASEQRESDGK